VLRRLRKPEELRRRKWQAATISALYRVQLRTDTPVHVRLTLPLDSNPAGKERTVLWTLFVILLVLWALGLVTSYTLGGFIHLLLILAVVVLVQPTAGSKDCLVEVTQTQSRSLGLGWF